MREALYVVILIALAVGTFAIRRSVNARARRKRENGTAGFMDRRLLGQRGQDALLHVNKLGFVLIAIIATAALVLLDQWGGGVEAGRTHAVIVIAGMTVITAVRLARWDKNGQRP